MKENFRKKILKNGMTLLFEKRELPVVSVAFAVKCGGVNEPIAEKGISHLIEHMLYKGTPSRNSKEIAEQIEKNGGELNGFTSEEVTAFWCKMPSEKLEIALNVLSDIVKNSVFDDKEYEKEKKVIYEEIKMRRDNPMVYVFDRMKSFLYGGSLGENLIGNEKTLKSVDREKAYKKYKEIYSPNNLILCVVGDADFDKIARFAEENFGNEKGKIPEEKIPLKNEIKTERRKGLDQANLVFAYHVPVAEDEKNYAAQVLSAITAEGMSSRLFCEIREKRNLAYAIKGGSDINKKFAYNFIYAGAMKQNVEKIKKIILDEFKKISKDFDEKELEDAKTQLIGNYKISMEESQGQLIELIASEIQGDAREFYDYEKKIKKVKMNDVKEIVAKVIDGNYSFFALVPED